MQAPLWVHAVSVGETLAAAPLIRLLLERWPERRVVVTTMTPTGSERVIALFDDRVFHAYLPYDLPGAMARFVNSVQPALLIVMETELWPNLLHQCRQAGCRTLLVNARLSEKSARGYGRFPKLTQTMLQQLDVIAVQADADAERFRALGATPEQVQVTGSLKFDMTVPDGADSPLTGVFARIREMQRPVLVAASTREGEEEKVLAAFQACLEKRPDLLLILVPRHPERFNAVSRLCQERGLKTIRRSADENPDAATRVFLGDSMGEMWNYFRCADLAFVGGSLVNTGCHNVLEPAALGLPVLTGPSQFNFATICGMLEQAGALTTVPDEQELAIQVLQLLENPGRRAAMGAAGRQIVVDNRGALDRVVALIDAQLSAPDTEVRVSTDG